MKIDGRSLVNFHDLTPMSEASKKVRGVREELNVHISHTQIQRVLLLFWGAWFAIVTLTNLGDALLALGIVSPDWKFASGNYGMIQQVVGRYSTPGWLTMPLFLGVIAWEGLAAALLVRAGAAFGRADGDPAARASARLAYAVGLGLFAAFLLVDEFFVAYQMEGSHLRILVAHVVCLMHLETSRSFGSATN